MKSTLGLRILLTSCLMISGAFAQKESRVLKEDVLVFRVQTRHVFLGQLKTYLNHLQSFHCLFPESHLLKLAEVNYADALQVQKKSVAQMQEQSGAAKNLMKLVLAQVYFNSLELSLERNFDLELALDKCNLGRFGTWNNELKSLVQAELYLRYGEERPKSIGPKIRESYYQDIDAKMDYEFYL